MFDYSMQFNCTWKYMHSQEAGLFFQTPPPCIGNFILIDSNSNGGLLMVIGLPSEKLP
jgi:hypothetical protein